MLLARVSEPATVHFLSENCLRVGIGNSQSDYKWPEVLDEGYVPLEDAPAGEFKRDVDENLGVHCWQEASVKHSHAIVFNHVFDGGSEMEPVRVVNPLHASRQHMHGVDQEKA